MLEEHEKIFGQGQDVKNKPKKVIKEYEETMTLKSEEIFNDFTLEIVKLVKLMLQFETYNDDIYNTIE